MNPKLSQCPDLTKPITLICKSTSEDVEVDLPGYEVIDSHKTVAFAQSISEADYKSLKESVQFMKFFNILFKGEIKLSAREPKYESIGVQHGIGLIILCKKAMVEGKTPYLRYPEAYLHPKYQSQLADLVIAFNPGHICDKSDLAKI